jgi:hypothetical protein
VPVIPAGLWPRSRRSPSQEADRRCSRRRRNMRWLTDCLSKRTSREDEFWATSRGPSDEVSSGWAESPPTMQTDASSRQLTRFPSSLRCGHPAMGWISRLLRHSVGGARGGLKVCAIRPSRPVWVVYGHESNFLQNKKPTRPVRLSRSAADLRPLLTQSGRLEAVPRAAPNVAYGARGLLDADGADQRSSTFRLSAAISIFP